MKSRKTTRAGFTMVEMLTVMTAMSLLLVICVSWLHYCMSYASTTRVRMRYHQNLSRLSNQLRNDVRQAKSMSLLDPNKLQLNLNDNRKLIYEIDAMNIDFEESKGGTTTRRERFDLSPRSVIRFDNSEMPSWITLLVERVSPPGIKKLSGDNRRGASSPNRVTDANANETVEQKFELVVPVDLHVRVGPNPWNNNVNR